MSSREIAQLERDRERAGGELREARECIQKLREQLADAQQEAEKAQQQQKTLRREFER